MRKFATIVGLLLITLAASAQFQPRAIFPETDPNAFKITTQANLEEAMKRIARLKSQLATTKDDSERKFLLNAILEMCQGQLNEGRNDSGVIVVETSSKHRQTPDLPVRWQGAFPAIEDEIRSLGEEGLAKYEETYGARAATLLDQAVATGQRDRIQDLNRRFGLTKAGIRAGVLLATMSWEEGEINRSARSLERVLELTELLSVEERAHYSAWLGHCYHQLGERANLSRLIETTIVIRDREVDAGGAKIKLGEQLSKLLLTTRDATLDTIDGLGVEWPGGNYSNTGLHEAPSDYSSPAWYARLPELSARANWMQFMNYPSPLAPPYLPIFDGDMFYVNIGDSLLGYSLIGGDEHKPAWICKPFDTFESNWRTSEPDPGMILPVSVYRGTVFTAIENPLSTTYHDPNPDPNFRLYSHYPKVRRALCAVDGASGRLLWKLGGLYEGDRDQQTNFLSAVVHEGTLYAIASRVPSMAEIFLYALNPDTGEIKWNLRLCYGQQETTMFGRPAREPHPSLPCIAAGRLYLSTNIGGVACVELATRSINWISRYDYIPRPITKYIETYYRDVTWYNSPTIYTEHEGQAYILAAPTDSRELIALDARTGKILWDLNQEHQLNGGRALVGARDGVCYVAGDGGDNSRGAGSLLHSVDIAKGRILKSVRVTPEGRGNVLALAGRPCIAANRLLWPGQQFGNAYCTISEVDLDSMRVVNSESVSSSYAGQGYNVFAQHGVVFTVSQRDYSQGNAQLAARFNSASLLEAARKEYSAHPDSAEAAVRYGLLTLRMGDKAEAVKALEKGYRLANQPPADLSTRDQAARALVEHFLELADKALNARKYAEVLGFVRNAREFAAGRNQLTQCFVREERALTAEGRAADIEAFYRGVMRDDPDFGMGENPEIPVATYCRIRLAERLESAGKYGEAVALWQEVQESPDRYAWNNVPLRTLALERMREAIRVKGREVYAPQEEKAKSLLEAGSSEALQKCLRLYPLAIASDAAALELAWEKRKAWAPKEAGELLRRAIDENPDRPRLAEINALLALCYKDAGERLRARLLATRVLREHPKGSLKVAGESLFFESILKPLTEGDTGESAEEALPQLPTQIQKMWERKWDVSGFTRLPEQIVSQSEPRIYLGETNRLGNHIVAVDAKTGRDVWQREVPVSITEAHRTPRGVLFVQGNGFSLYDDEGGVQWESPSGGTPHPVSIDGALLVYGTRFFNTRTRQNMVHINARDADSGSELWETELEGSSVHWIGQTPYGIVVVTLGNEVTMYRLEPEFGAIQAQRILDTQGRITVAPALMDDRVLVADRDGKMHVLDLEKLTTVRTFETRVRYPTMLEPVGSNILIVGLSNVAMFDATNGAQVWAGDYGNNAAVTAQVKLKDSIVIATRTPGTPGKIIGFKLADGKRTFTYDIPRANDSDRVDLQRAAPFDGGLVVAFTDNRITDGRMGLWGFRLVVLNADGTERFKWEHRVDASALFTQLALIDNHITFTCDSTTFCFGRGE